MAKKAKGGKKGKKKKKKKKKKKVVPAVVEDTSCGYLLDIIVVSFALPGLEPTKMESIELDAMFNNQELKITSSRINVIDFVPDRTFEFDIDTKTVCGLMKKFPLEFTVFHGKDTLGTATLEWPDTVIRAMEKREMITQFHKSFLIRDVDEAEKQEKQAKMELLQKLTQQMQQEKEANDNEKSGKKGKKGKKVKEVEPPEESEKEEEIIDGPSIEFFYRLQPKCYEIPDPFITCLPDKCQAAQKFISPNDVIFLVGDQAKQEVCPEGIELNPVKKNERLDFAAYRIYHGAIMNTTPELPNTFCSLDCCKIKEVAREFGPGAFDTLHCEKEMEEENRFKPVCYKSLTPEPSPTTSMDDLVDKRTVAEVSESLRPKKPLLRKNRCVDSEAAFAKGRKCRFCNVRLKFLDPKSPCPVCGMKPFVKPKEKRPQDFTVDEILQDYIDKNPPENADCLDCYKPPDTDAIYCKDPKDDEPEVCPCLARACRCRCAPGCKTCAFCRVRNACEVVDLRDIDIYNEPTEPQNLDEGCELGPDEEEVVRPFIERVFLELREIYQIDPEADKKCKIRSDRNRRSIMMKKSVRPPPGEYQTYNATPTICKEVKLICKQLGVKKRKCEPKKWM